MEVILSPKFQIVIPKQVRKRLGLQSRQKMQLLVRNNIIELVPDRPIEELKGLFPGLTLEGLRDEKDRF